MRAALLVLAAAWLVIIISGIVVARFAGLDEPHIVPGEGSTHVLATENMGRDSPSWLLIGVPVGVLCGSGAFYLVRRSFAKPSY
jgi:hypothetical protein